MKSENVGKPFVRKKKFFFQWSIHGKNLVNRKVFPYNLEVIVVWKRLFLNAFEDEVRVNFRLDLNEGYFHSESGINYKAFK